MPTSAVQDEIDRFLQTGDYDPFFLRFSGTDHLDRMKRGHTTLEDALWETVRFAERDREPSTNLPIPADIASFTRIKFEPMVRGLFRRDECDRVLSLLTNSVVFVTRGNIEEFIRRESLGTAWDIANLYLRSIGADVISENAPCIVGLSVDSTCYVSVEYFTDEDPFADYVVHEAAHIFHNVKRRTIGLKEKRSCEWLLPIKFQKRETFAYSCEVYSRMVELCPRQLDRRRLLPELQTSFSTSDYRVSVDEVIEILTEAVQRRNGWNIILERCSSL
jgi:hypothetical protein